MTRIFTNLIPGKIPATRANESKFPPPRPPDDGIPTGNHAAPPQIVLHPLEDAFGTLGNVPQTKRVVSDMKRPASEMEREVTETKRIVTEMKGDVPDTRSNVMEMDEMVPDVKRNHKKAIGNGPDIKRNVIGAWGDAIEPLGNAAQIQRRAGP